MYSSAAKTESSVFCFCWPQPTKTYVSAIVWSPLGRVVFEVVAAEDAFLLDGRTGLDRVEMLGGSEEHCDLCGRKVVVEFVEEMNGFLCKIWSVLVSHCEFTDESVAADIFNRAGVSA